jgi:hypothetical protein
MTNYEVERKALYESAKIFTEFGWIFREQPILDFGIDAFVEICENNRPTGQLIALQIKGGNSVFKRKKDELILYFSDSHKEYWLAYSKTMPVLIVLFDSNNSSIYWEIISEGKITKTPKNWKISIPYSNKLVSSKHALINIIAEYEKNRMGFELLMTFLENSKKDNNIVEEDIFVKYCNEKEKGLICKIKRNNIVSTFELTYIPRVWDELNNSLSSEDPYYFTILDLSDYIRNKYQSLISSKPKNILKILKNEIEQIIKTGGIDEIAKMMFNFKNSELGLYSYIDFINAFEHYTGFKKGQYTASPIGQYIIFEVMQKKYQIHTDVGLVTELKYIIDNKFYEEIYTDTFPWIWSDIYLDAGILKEDFAPVILKEWEEYWEKHFYRINSLIGTAENLEKSRERSWRQVQIFLNNYDEVGDIINFAFEIDEMVLYPLAVITMLNIFDQEVCYQEYCEFYFADKEWDYIDDVNEDDEDEVKMFYIRDYEL